MRVCVSVRECECECGSGSMVGAGVLLLLFLSFCFLNFFFRLQKCMHANKITKDFCLTTQAHGTMPPSS